MNKGKEIEKNRQREITMRYREINGESFLKTQRKITRDQ